MPDDIKLLPCPFCGGEAYIFTSDDGKPRWVSCNDCEADGPHCQAVSDVVKGWNHRASLVEDLPQADNTGSPKLPSSTEVWNHVCEYSPALRTDEQVAALEKHCLSTALYYNAPTCNSYTDLNEAINKGQVDARVSYSFDVGLTELTSASKLKSANAILQNMFVVKLGDKVIEKPTIRDLLLEEVILTEKVKRTPPTSHDRTVMDAVSAFFNTEAPKLQAASEDDRAQLVSDKLEDLDQKIEGIWAKVKPFIFELGSTGITPEGVEVWDADALQAKYPDVSLSKAEKEGSFFEVNGVLFTMYQSKAYVSVSP